MKNPLLIKAATVKPLQAKLIIPFRIATGQHDSVDNVLFTLQLNDGTQGFGEAAVATHITGETIPQTIKTLQCFAKICVGQTIGDYITLCAKAHEYCGSNKAALAAIEMSLFDALTRTLKMPLWQYWGHKPNAFKTDITIVIGTLDETIEQTKRFYKQGLRAFKIKIGRDMDIDFKRVSAVSRIVGKSSIILDANQGYSAKQTLTFLSMLAKAKVRVDLIEQPVPKTDWEGLKEVTRKTKVLVCADESVSSLPDAVRAIKEKAVDVINIKLMKTGLTHAVEIIRLAQANDMGLMMGGMMETSLAMTCSAHLVAGLGGIRFIDLDTPYFIKDGLKGNPCLSTSGVYDLKGIKAGIGVKP